MNNYCKPKIISERIFETTSLACGKTTTPPPGSWHTGSAYDTFTGHFGTGFVGLESTTGSYGIGFGPGGTSGSASYYEMCGVWISFSS